MNLSNPMNPHRITVVFRYDDYSERSDTEAELFLLAMLKQVEAACTFGVVPCITPADEDIQPQVCVKLGPRKMQILKSALREGLVEAAQHGFTHQTRLLRDEGGWTEFAGLDYVSQVDRIRQGKRMLEDNLRVPINTFIPPWNSYDPNTLAALEHLGFRCISAGKYGTAIKPCRLSFLPSTCNILELPAAVEASRTGHTGRSVVVALFHPIELADQSLRQRVLELLLWAKNEADIEISTVQQAIGQGSGLDARQYASYFRSPTRRFLPASWRKPLLYYPLTRGEAVGPSAR